jgi:hypothetical protein
MGPIRAVLDKEASELEGGIRRDLGPRSASPTDLGEGTKKQKHKTLETAKAFQYLLSKGHR